MTPEETLQASLTQLQTRNAAFANAQRLYSIADPEAALRGLNNVLVGCYAMTGITEYKMGTAATSAACVYCSSLFAKGSIRCKSCGAPKR